MCESAKCTCPIPAIPGRKFVWQPDSGFSFMLHRAFLSPARAPPMIGCMPHQCNAMVWYGIACLSMGIFSPPRASEGPKGRHGKVSSRRRTSSFSARKSAYMASARIYMASRISTAIVFPPSKKKKRGWKVERVGHGKVFSCRSRDQPSNHVKES